MAFSSNDRNVFLEADGAHGKVLNAVEPYIRKRVLKLYGEKTTDVSVCPGETKCQIFESAAGKTRRQKEKNVCFTCPMFSTKTDEGRRGHKSLESLASRSLSIRTERLTGYPRKEWMMTNYEFAGLCIAEQIFEQEEVSLKENTLTMLCTLAGVKRE